MQGLGGLDAPDLAHSVSWWMLLRAWVRLGGPRWTGVGDGRWGVLSGRTLDMRKGLLDAAQAVVGADDRLGVGVGQAPTCPFQPARVRARFPRVAVDTPGGAGKAHERTGAEPLPGDLLECRRLGVVMGRADVLDHQEEECAICTARNAVVTVRTYGLAPPRQCASPPTQPAQFQRESASGPPNAPQ